MTQPFNLADHDNNVANENTEGEVVGYVPHEKQKIQGKELDAMVGFFRKAVTRDQKALEKIKRHLSRFVVKD